MLETLEIRKRRALHIQLSKILHLMMKATSPSYHSDQTMIPCQIISKIVKSV